MSDKPEAGEGVQDKVIEKTELPGLDIGLIRAAMRSNAYLVQNALEKGANVNAQDHNKMTALHYVAAKGARPCIRLLVGTGKCNYLLKDAQGRYAYELAYEWAKDYAVGRLLAKKQRQQALKEGVPAWSKK